MIKDIKGIGGDKKPRRCPVVILRDLALSGIAPSEKEIDKALRELGAARRVTQRGTVHVEVTFSEMRRVIMGLLAPQIDAVASPMVAAIPHLGKVT